MSSRSQELRASFIEAGSPLKHHSLNQGWMKRVADGERRHQKILQSKKARRAVREVLKRQSNMDAYWQAIRTGGLPEEYVAALDERGFFPPAGFLPAEKETLPLENTPEDQSA